jgi:hypothetical protein
LPAPVDRFQLRINKPRAEREREEINTINESSGSYRCRRVKLILTLKAAKSTPQSIFDHKENNLLIVLLSSTSGRFDEARKMKQEGIEWGEGKRGRRRRRRKICGCFY